MLINQADVVVEDRIRNDEVKGAKDDWGRFKASFRVHGQLQAIRVEAREDGKYRLIAGGRRYTAITELHAEGVAIPNLPPQHIEATYGQQQPLHMQLMAEFAENEQRKDFTFIEKAKFIRKFHDMMVLQHGKDAWNQELTAHTLKLSPASISHYLRVEEAAKSDEAVAKAQTLDAAVKRMKVKEKLDDRKEAVKNESQEAVTRAEAILHNGDAREWIKTIPDESIDFINFDPPWGDDASFKSQENHESFDDSREYSDALMEALFPHLFRVLKNDRFCAFWFGAQSAERSAKLAEVHGFNLQFTRTPCIWYKPDKVADQNRNPERQLIESYETFYLLRKGNPLFHERFTHNVFEFDRVSLGSVVHPCEKPTSLCSSIIRLTTVPGERVLDPVAGSSAMLEESLRNNRKAVGCERSERHYQTGIVRLAEYLKTFSEQ